MALNAFFYACIPMLLLPGFIQRVVAADLSRTHLNRFLVFMVVAILFAAAVLLPLSTPDNWPFLTAVVVVMPPLVYFITDPGRAIHRRRSIILLIDAALLLGVFADVRLVGGFNDVARETVQNLVDQNVLLGALDADALRWFFLVAAGILFITIEMNHPIALALQASRVMPEAVRQHGVPEDEPSRGKVIGYLERAVVFILTLTGNFGALGLVLAAKGIARFKQLDNRAFAEYVLIGTLLSNATALFVALVLRIYLP